MATERRPSTRGPRLSKTFPHRIILVISLVLCMCACGSIVLGVICWANELLGYYWGTGFWSGGVILFAGMFGIVSSIVRNVCAAKTFMIISIFGCIVSLGMIALACGGLDSTSGFYDGGNRSSFLTHISHAVYLGLGVLQLTLCVLSDGMCVYYLFYGTNAQLYTVVNDKQKKNKTKPIVRKNKNRSSTGSQVPLVRASQSESLRSSGKRKSKSKSDTNVNNNDEQFHADDLPISYPGAAHQLETGNLHRPETRISSPLMRSASFSTFGRHPHGPDQVSLIVHPNDDNASVANTDLTETPARPRNVENHYAQTLLFDPPLPIEEDETLPPYEAVDSNPYENVNSDRRRKRRRNDESPVTCLYIHRSRSLPVRAKRHDTRHKRGSLRTQVPRGTPDSGLPGGGHEQRTPLHNNVDLQIPKPIRPIPVGPLSRSADLLSFENETDSASNEASAIDARSQGVRQKRFAPSTDRMVDNSVVLRNKHTQSMRSDRKTRVDRHRRAISAEIKPNKEGLYPHERLSNHELGARSSTSSLDGSNSSLFADNRIMPTKFSLRKPVRQLGMPHVCSPVPVKPPQAANVKSPPPKPPRTHSVTADDLQKDDCDYVNLDEAETVFANINGLTNGKRDYAGPENVPQLTNGVYVPKNKSVTRVTDETHHKPTNEPVAILDSGPVLRCMPPAVVNVDKHAGDDDVFSSNSVVLPTSPVLTHPSLTTKPSNRSSKHSKTDSASVSDSKVDNNGTAELKSPRDVEKRESDSAVYAKVIKNTTVSPTSPQTRVQRSRKLYFSFSDKDNISVFDPSPVTENNPGLESEQAFEVEDKVTVKHLAEVPETTVVDDKQLEPKGDNNDKNMNDKSIGSAIQENKKHVNGKSLESSPALLVRSPAVSPSERILQRKNLTSNIELGNSSPKEQKKSPETHGARPKTTAYKHLFSPLPPPRKSVISPSQKPDLRLSSSSFDRQMAQENRKKTPDNSPSFTFLKSPKPPVYSKPTKPKSPTKRTISSPGVVVDVPSSSNVDSPSTPTSAASSPLHGTSGQSETKSPRTPTVPAPFSPTSPVRANSSSGNHQGVLTLPTPQPARHVPDQVQAQQVHVPSNPNIPAQPGNAADSLHRPLFSVLL